MSLESEAVDNLRDAVNNLTDAVVLVLFAAQAPDEIPEWWSEEPGNVVVAAQLPPLEVPEEDRELWGRFRSYKNGAYQYESWPANFDWKKFNALWDEDQRVQRVNRLARERAALATQLQWRADYARLYRRPFGCF